MSRLVLIAHAETSATRRATFARDEPLEPRGLERARSCAPWRADAVWCSPAPAARETAMALGLAAMVEPALRDLDVGRWAGQDLATIAAADPEGLAAFLADPAFAGHGGESIQELVRRVTGWLDGLRGERGQLVAVSHAAVVRAAVQAVLDAPAAAFFRIDVAPLDRLALSGNGRRWALRLDGGAA